MKREKITILTFTTKINKALAGFNFQGRFTMQALRGNRRNSKPYFRQVEISDERL